MDRCARSQDLEILARMAARHAGQEPDRRVTIRFGDIVAFDDAAWRYPDFILRAEAAYAALTGDLPAPDEIGTICDCFPETSGSISFPAENREPKG